MVARLQAVIQIIKSNVIKCHNGVLLVLEVVLQEFLLNFGFPGNKEHYTIFTLLECQKFLFSSNKQLQFICVKQFLFLMKCSPKISRSDLSK